MPQQQAWQPQPQARPQYQPPYQPQYQPQPPAIPSYAMPWERFAALRVPIWSR